MLTAKTLILDIGSGTQDVLYYNPDLELENCPKFVLPSPARLVAARIQELTARGRNIHLFGRNMGGGFYKAVKAHLEAGLTVSATRAAAYSLGDDLAKVEKMGVRLRETQPKNAIPVHLADYDPGFWESFLGMAGLEPPEAVAACAQDHGFHPGESNRLGRFKLWESFLTKAHGRLESLIYDAPPSMMTRLAALQESIGGGPVADTASGAVLGALFDPAIEEICCGQGGVVLNMGNSHILAALVHGDKAYGIYEHHTGVRNPQEIWEDLARFRRGELTNQEVFDAWGHGCMTLDLPAAANGFKHTAVIGPQRGQMAGFDALFPCPGGDMMLAGCFGLIKGLNYVLEESDG